MKNVKCMISCDSYGEEVKIDPFGYIKSSDFCLDRGLGPNIKVIGVDIQGFLHELCCRRVAK